LEELDLGRMIKTLRTLQIRDCIKKMYLSMGGTADEKPEAKQYTQTADIH
jgi:hypothetical protein